MRKVLQANRLVAWLTVFFAAAFTTSSIASPDKTLFWMFLGAPLGDSDVRDLVISPDNDFLWYVGSSTNGLYITRNAGSSWEQHLSGAVGAIAVDPRAPYAVYTAVGSEIYVSVDWGQTWNLLVSFPNPIPGDPANSPTTIDSLLVSAIDGTIVVGLTSMLHSARIYKSEVVGGFLFWSVAWESPYGYHIWDLAEDPVNGYWFFCTEESGHLVDPIVMRSTTRGASWEEMVPLRGSLIYGHGLNLEVHPQTQIVYFLTESSTLYHSFDSGDSWSLGTYVDFGSSLLVDPSCPNRLFGGEMIRGVKVGGVYISESTGQSFLFEGPAYNSISSLGLNSTSTTLLAVANGAGLWELDLSGDISCSSQITLFADGFESGDLWRWPVTTGQ